MTWSICTKFHFSYEAQHRFRKARYVGAAVVAHVVIQQPIANRRCYLQLNKTSNCTLKATGGSKHRSLCSLVCKWTFRGQSDEKGLKGWDDTYFRQIGLEELAFEKYERIGTTVLNPGEFIGNLDETAAEELGLPKTGIKVACGLIDAHAGTRSYEMQKVSKNLVELVSILRFQGPFSSILFAFC